ncbi:hypothetical protein ACTQ16_16400 [Prevotella sp. LCP21S3_D2]|uniref:hypothetical protein n=1 Tax=Prevotella sp. LCP21S3_D2 TaxID=3438800 RepID=UPI003F9BD242
MKRLLIILLALLSALVLTGCATRRQLQVVERTSVDTVYLSNVQYDSIYIFQDRQLDRSRDTVYLRDVSVEYRYRHLRDTIYKVQHDSIPYQVTVTEVKEITRPLSIFDHLTHFTFWLVVGALLLLIIRVIIRLKKSRTIR